MLWLAEWRLHSYGEGGGNSSVPWVRMCAQPQAQSAHTCASHPLWISVDIARSLLTIWCDCMSWCRNCTTHMHELLQKLHYSHAHEVRSRSYLAYIFVVQKRAECRADPCYLSVLHMVQGQVPEGCLIWRFTEPVTDNCFSLFQGIEKYYRENLVWQYSPFIPGTEKMEKKAINFVWDRLLFHCYFFLALCMEKLRKADLVCD